MRGMWCRDVHCAPPAEPTSWNQHTGQQSSTWGFFILTICKLMRWLWYVIRFTYTVCVLVGRFFLVNTGKSWPMHPKPSPHTAVGLYKTCTITWGPTISVQCHECILRRRTAEENVPCAMRETCWILFPIGGGGDLSFCFAPKKSLGFIRLQCSLEPIYYQLIISPVRKTGPKFWLYGVPKWHVIPAF